MHDDNIEALRKKALYLLGVEKRIIQEMRNKEILKPKQAKAEATFDEDSVKGILDGLREEELKLENLDLVFAVVGTMKAGKSTTINAIVGMEVLPNRFSPMTAMPTLIRHTKEQTVPKLIFTNIAPLTKLMQRLCKQLNLPTHRGIKDKYNADSDMLALIEKIEKNQSIVEHTEGQNAIFEFLKGINDLVRLAPELGLEFPYSDYTNIDQLPCIEVEFAHLKALENTTGRFCILDTPGPNEAGQERLRPMMQDQLKKASAVLVVMDYTQLNSEADASIRKDLGAIADINKDRIYALVNKFDNKGKNDPDEKDTIKKVESLTNKTIVADRIFLVSAISALLANDAKQAVELQGKLPDASNGSWVKDFIDRSGLDDDEIDDIDRVKKKITKLWGKSNFAEPLEKVISASYSRMALMALASSAAKINKYAGDINNFLGIQEQALGKGVAELNKTLLTLERDKETIEKCEKHAEEIKGAHFQDFQKKLAQITTEAQNITKTRIIELLGQEKESEPLDHYTPNDQARNLSSTFFPLFSFRKNKKAEKAAQKLKEDYGNELSKNTIDFGTNEERAKTFMSAVHEVVSEVVNGATSNINSLTSNLLSNFEESFWSDVTVNAEIILQGITTKLTDAGFELTLKLPEKQTIGLKFNADSSLLNVIEVGEKQKRRLRAQDSWWGGLKRSVDFGLFSTSAWGYDEYHETVTVYKTNLDKLIEATKTVVDRFFENLDDEISSKIKQPLADSTANYFLEFKKVLEHVRGDISNVIQEKERSQENQKKLLDSIQTFKPHLATLKETNAQFQIEMQDMDKANSYSITLGD